MSQDHGTGQEGAGDLTHDERTDSGIAQEPQEERGRHWIEDEFLGDDQVTPAFLKRIKVHARAAGMSEAAVRRLR